MLPLIVETLTPARLAHAANERPARPDQAEADRFVQTGGRLGGDLVAVRAAVPKRHAADLVVVGSDFRAALLVAPACG